MMLGVFGKMLGKGEGDTAIDVRLDNKVAIVTGVDSGISLAGAELSATRGELC